MVNSYYHHELKNLKDDVFIKKVVHFLMELESRFGKNVPIDELKRKYDNDYDRIVRYLQSGKNSTDHLIAGNEKGWSINNWNVNKVQDLIARVIQEDSLLEQTKLLESQNKLQKSQNNILKLYTITTLLIFFATFANLIKIKLTINTEVGLFIYNGIIILIFVGLLIFLVYFIKKIKD